MESLSGNSRRPGSNGLNRKRAITAPAIEIKVALMMASSASRAFAMGAAQLATTSADHTECDDRQQLEHEAGGGEPDAPEQAVAGAHRQALPPGLDCEVDGIGDEQARAQAECEVFADLQPHGAQGGIAAL